MKQIVYALTLALPVALGLPATGAAADPMRFTALEGGTLDLTEFRGQVLVVVNTASFCGYTPQYEALQELHETDPGVTVIGLPSDDFGGQEYADSADVAEFCDAMFGITFPMSDIVHVRGPDAHDFFGWAAAQDVPGAVARWNFHKWIIAPDGTLSASLPTQVTPDSREMNAAIQSARQGL